VAVAAAAVAVCWAAVTAGRPRRGLAAVPRRRGGRGTACFAEPDGASTATEAPPKREAPTPFPKDKLFKPQMERALLLLPKEGEEAEDPEELVDVLDELIEMHEWDRQWVLWPRRLAHVRGNSYNFGLYKFVRGLLRCIDQSYDEDLRVVSIELFHALIVEGVTLTKIDPIFAIECGSLPIVARAAHETMLEPAIETLRKLITTGPAQVVPTAINLGVVKIGIDIVQSQGRALPMAHLAALDMLVSLAKLSPARCVEVGLYESVKIVANPALVPRRNRILNLLRPLVEHEGEEEMTTNIRFGGVPW